MSNAALNAVFARSRARGVARLVLLSIADRADETGSAWCGVTDIAARAHIARSNVHRALDTLEALGELSSTSRAGRHGCNVYQLAPSLLAGGEPGCPPSETSSVLTMRTPHPETILTLKQACPQDEAKCPHGNDYTLSTPPNPHNTSGTPENNGVSREENFLASLQTNPAYRGLDLATEKLKAEAWISASPGRKFTRRFLVNWLNRAQAAHAAATTPAPARKIKFQL